VKLALATGAPIVPVFSIRTPSGKVRLCVEPAIFATADDGIDAAMKRVADVIGKYIRLHGDQWLMLQPAWGEGK
jgi:lauroyl/myristoyl acyltransferase